MKRALIAFLTFGVVLAAVAGFAASMNVGGSSLGAGQGTVAKCDDVTVAWGTPAWNGTAFTVAQVTIAEDNSDEGSATHSCTGKAARVQVGSSSANGNLTGTPASVTLTFDTPVVASAVGTVDVVVG